VTNTSVIKSAERTVQP